MESDNDLAAIFLADRLDFFLSLSPLSSLSLSLSLHSGPY